MVERKFDWHGTVKFTRALRSLHLDEYEQAIFVACTDRFCASLDKSCYKPVEYSGRLYFELPVLLFSRTLKIYIEVDGIDATLFDIEIMQF